jgi:hypothetical protein
MARKTFNYTHADIGTKPTSALDFAKNERPNAGNFDWYWYNVIEAIKDHAVAFSEIDSDDDGVVDEADTLTAGGNLKGDLNATNGETLWDESGGYIPQTQLQNTSVSVSAGDGLKGGGSVSLGGSTTINVEPANFAGAGLQDDGADDLELVNDSITVGGNVVSLGGSTAISHGDLSDAPTSAHHAKYTDSEAVSAVNAKNSLNVSISGDAGGDADTVDGKHYTDIQNWVNVSADVPNADYADTAGDADTLDGQQWSDIQTWVNTNADVPNADHADTAGDADTLDGNHYSDIQTWVNNNADVPNADTLDGQHYSDIQTWVNNNADVPNADYADNSDQVDGIDASGLAKLGDGVEIPVYNSKSDIPSSIGVGEVVVVKGDDRSQFYIEDGT